MNDIITSRLDKINDFVSEALEKDDPYIVINQMKLLMEAEALIGMAKAKFIYLLHVAWSNFSLSSQESMADIVYQSLNIHPHTQDRYIDLWKHKDELPAELQDRPVNQLSPITKALAQGYDLDEYWDDLDNSTNATEIRDVLRKAKGQEPRKGSLQIYIEQDGSIVAWKNQIRYSVGYLDISSSDEAIQQATNRIVNNSGIIIK